MNLLLKTKLRRKLLSYFFTHPDENYYVRELAVFIGEDPGNLSRELKKLEAEKLFTSHTRGKSKYYSLNKTYPLYKEFREIVFKTEGVEGALRKLVEKYKNISIAFIYGSYAKDTESKTSDIDLIIVGELPLNEFTREIRTLEAKIGREINFSHYDNEEFKKEKKKKGGFLNLITKDKIIILTGRLSDR